MKIFLSGWLILLLSVPAAWGQAVSSLLEEKGGIYAVVKDVQGETLEGYLRLPHEEVAVLSADNEEKSVPAKYIRSITLEKIKGEAPGEDPKKAGYKVQLENSKELYTLKNKFSFSLNTNLGLVTRTIDPDRVNSMFSKDVAPSLRNEELKSFIQDKSIVFSLEFKF